LTSKSQSSDFGSFLLGGKWAEELILLL